MNLVGKQGNQHVGHTCQDDVAQTSPMDELAPTSSPPATVHVGHGGQQRGAAPAPSLGTATAVSDMLIVAGHGQLQGAEGGISAVA